MQRAINFLTLFTSSSTLICCALPALLVALGSGSVMAALVTHVPGLIWISANKVGVFIFAACMLTLGGIMQWRNRTAPCPIDPALAARCMQTRRWSLRVYLLSLLLFFVGGFFAFIAPYLL